MPKTEVIIYLEESGKAPFLEWFGRLLEKVQDKIFVRIERLREFGHELHRPEADYLHDDIYELRIRHQSVNYRILYFFHGRQLVVLSHGFSKQQSRVPDSEMKLAVLRRKRFTESPNRHTYRE